MIAYSEFLNRTIDLSSIISIEIKDDVYITGFSTVGENKDKFYNGNIVINIQHLGGEEEHVKRIKEELTDADWEKTDEALVFKFDQVHTRMLNRIKKEIQPLIDVWMEYKGQNNIKIIPIGS